MNENLEKKLRVKVRKIVESILDEETPMIPADDFKPKTKITTTSVNVGLATVRYNDASGEFIIQQGSRSLSIDMDTANKLAKYLYRVAGK